MPSSEPHEGFPTAEDEKFFADFRDAPQPEHWRVPPQHRIPCDGCGQFMTYRRGHLTHEGDYSIDTYELECQHGCVVTAEITYREYIPIEVARAQEERRMEEERKRAEKRRNS